MREKYESLSVTVLREVAKSRGLKHLSGLKKSELVDRMVAEDERISSENQSAEKTEEKQQPEDTQEEKIAQFRESRQERGDKYNRGEQKERIERQERNEKAEKSERSDRIERMEKTNRKAERVERSERMEKTERNDRAERVEKTERSDRPERVERSERNERGDRQERKSTKIITSDGIEIDNPELDSGISAHGILEVLPDGYGFIRCENYLPGEHDVYVSPSQIRKFGLKTGDIINGNTRVKTQQEKFSALLYIRSINGCHPSEILRRPNFEDLTPIFPNERIRLETNQSAYAMRIMDLVSPIGKGQRGMIVSPPKAGKTTLLKQVAKAVTRNNPEMHLIILLIDERPEEVTDIKEAIEGKNVEVIYSTFDELPEHHKRVSEMVIERARRLVEHKKDVMILLDSITRLARAYNFIGPPSGRTLSGGIDPAALHMPKRFFGAARNMREGGSITILATALVDTGSRMDDVDYEEFKGTGNMELILDRKLSERRIFPAVDITKSGTRREDLLLIREEQEAVEIMRRAINGMKAEEAVESILNLFVRTNNNRDFCQMIKKTKLL